VRAVALPSYNVVPPGGFSAEGLFAVTGRATRHVDASTRTARALRRAVTRWFAVLGVPPALIVLAMSLALVPNWAAVGGVLAGGAMLLAAQVLGMRRVLQGVDRLDQERHGLREAYDRARLDALRDGLTGLGNHRAFQEELVEQVAIARSDDRPFALLYVDVDDLKKFNDAQGHASGDSLLVATARILTSNMRRGDRGFRIGGDEFAVVLTDCDLEDAVAIGRRILSSALAGGAVAHGADPFSMTIGVSAFPTPAGDRQQLIRQADAALYWGKRHGRTEVQAFDPARHGMAEDGRPLEELASAVSAVAANRRLTPVYQPIYDLATGQVAGYEGLVRPLPDAGFANAGALFVAAEAAGRTVELDLASLETVLAGAAGIDPSLYLSVNLSPRSVEAPAFTVFDLLSIARRYDIDSSRLVVELTEREEVEDLDRLRTGLAALRRHGVRIAADDVGAGNAGLRLLSEVTFDIMKIDLTLVRAGAASQSADAVLRALRGLARRQGQKIVAEGVETLEELGLVMDLGFDSVQGYLLQRPAAHLEAKPLDFDAFREVRTSDDAEPQPEQGAA
jgi:diguanylate cyclase (GGDEF)-like protein